MNRIICILILSFYSLFAQEEQANLELAVPFTDNMILQQETKVPVWGFDQPKTKVTVEFAGQKKSVVADKFGDWMVKLEPLSASLEEKEMRIGNDRGESITLSGVLVGEVWFSSGQSNMVWVAGKSMCNELADLAQHLESIAKQFRV